MTKSLAVANKDQLLASVNTSGHPQAAAMRRVVEEVVTVAERFAVRRAELDADPKLSALGRRETLKQELPKQHARDLRDARAPIAAVKARLETMKNAVKVKPSIDPADIVGALSRMEIRTWLASLPQGERAPVALGTNDARIAEAILSAPPALSGLSDDVFSHVESAFQEKAFGPEMAEIEDLAELVASAEAAASVVREELRGVVEMDQRSFDGLMTPIERKQGAPWLQKSIDPSGKERIVVVPLEGGSARPATPDEVRDGVFYCDLAEYLAADGTLPQRQPQAA